MTDSIPVGNHNRCYKCRHIFRSGEIVLPVMQTMLGSTGMVASTPQGNLFVHLSCPSKDKK